VIGTRNMQKALFRALLMPLDTLKSSEGTFDFTTRMAVTEEFKDMPLGSIWDEFSAREKVPTGTTLLNEFNR